MFKKILQKIKERRQQIKTIKNAENKRKYYEIRGAVIKFYEDKQKADGNVELPAFMRADETLKEVIRTPADIDFYYKKLLKYRAVA